MKKQEFLDALRRSISGLNDYTFVNDTMAYYEDYIEAQIRMGKTEEEVLQELGDPRLIAKSIMATHEKTEPEDNEYQYGHDTQKKVFQRKGRVYHIPYWLYRLLTCLVVIAVVILSFYLITWLVPFLMMGFLLYFCYKFIKNIFR